MNDDRNSTRRLMLQAAGLALAYTAYIAANPSTSSAMRGQIPGPCHVCTDAQTCPSPTDTTLLGVPVMDALCKLSCSDETAVHVVDSCNTEEGNAPCGMDPYPASYDMGWSCQVP